MKENLFSITNNTRGGGGDGMVFGLQFGVFGFMFASCHVYDVRLKRPPTIQQYNDVGDPQISVHTNSSASIGKHCQASVSGCGSSSSSQQPASSSTNSSTTPLPFKNQLTNDVMNGSDVHQINIALRCEIDYITIMASLTVSRLLEKVSRSVRVCVHAT